MFVVARVYDRKRSGFRVAVADVKIFCCRFVTYVVGVRSDWQAVDKFKRFPVEDLARAICPIGYEQFKELGRVNTP